MSDNLNRAIAEVITKSIEGADFFIDKMPVAVQQLLSWKLIEEATGLLVSLLLISQFVLFLIKLLKMDIKNATKSTKWVEVDNLGPNGLTCSGSVVIILSGLGGILGLVTFPDYVASTFQLLFYPEAYLIEYAAGLM